MDSISPALFPSPSIASALEVKDEAAVNAMFGQVFIQLLSKGLETGDDGKGGLLGLQGPWSALLMTTLSESLAQNHSIEFGKLIMHNDSKLLPGGLND